jgi:hypothetical protein
MAASRAPFARLAPLSTAPFRPPQYLWVIGSSSAGNSVITRQPSDLIDFYPQIRALGSAGVTVPLDVERDGAQRHFDIKSMSRRDHLKLNSTF